jgi:hypothetical protein
MSSVKEAVKKLHAIANDLDCVNSVAPSAHDFVRAHANGSTFNVEHAVDEHILMHAGYKEGPDIRSFIIRKAADQLGRGIAEKLDYETKSNVNSFAQIPYVRWSGPYRYRATVHVFTPNELLKLIQRAIEVGRDSR